MERRHKDGHGTIEFQSTREEKITLKQSSGEGVSSPRRGASITPPLLVSS